MTEVSKDNGSGTVLNGLADVPIDPQTQQLQQAFADAEEVNVLQDMSPEALENMFKGRFRALKLCERLNNVPALEYTPGMSIAHVRSNPPEKLEILSELFNISIEKVKKDLTIFPPFLCDYGSNIEFKGSSFLNWNCVILDAGKITIGDQTLFGPGVKIFGSGHAIDPDERYTSPPLAFDVTIGNQVWIGGNATIVGPCTIGNGVVVAAGSVVIKGTYPDDVILGGNPARILKHITRKSKITSNASDTTT